LVHVTLLLMMIAMMLWWWCWWWCCDVYSVTFNASHLVVVKQHSLQSVRWQEVASLLLASSSSSLVSLLLSLIVCLPV